MIVLVQAGVQHDHGDIVHDERVVVAVGFQLPVEIQQQLRYVVLPAHQLPQAGAGARSEHDELRVAQAADHVGIDHDWDTLQGHGRMIDPVLRAEQAFLFAVPEGE